MNQKGYSQILIVFIIIIVSIAVFYVYVSKSLAPITYTTDITEPSPSASPTTEPPCDFSFIKHTKDTGGKFITTTDIKNNFELDYPSSWKWEIQNCDGFSYLTSQKTEISGKIGTSSDFHGYKSAEEFVKGKYAPGRELLPRQEERQLILNGYPAKRFFEQMLAGDDAPGGPYQGEPVTGVTYLIAKDNKVYSLSFQIEGKSYIKLTKEIDDIMKTFK